MNSIYKRMCLNNFVATLRRRLLKLQSNLVFRDTSISDQRVTFAFVFVLIHMVRVSPMTCSPEHPQKNYCQASWVIKGTILAYTHNPSSMEVYPPIERLYEVQIHRLFKAYNVSDAIWYEGSIASISTDGDMNGTGVDMLQGETYIISGSTFEGQAILTKCNWYQLWRTLSPCHEAHLETGVFDKNCKCPVATCIGKMCYQQVKDPGCVNYDYANTFDVCVYETTFNSCSWEKCNYVHQSGSSAPKQFHEPSKAQQVQTNIFPNEQGGQATISFQQQQADHRPQQQWQQTLNTGFSNTQQQQQQQQQQTDQRPQQQLQQPLNAGLSHSQQQHRSWSTLGMRYAHLRNRRKQRRPARRAISALLNAISSR